MRKVILESPFQWPTQTIAGDDIVNPLRPESMTLVPESQLSGGQILHCVAEEYAMIFRRVDAQKTAKAM